MPSPVFSRFVLNFQGRHCDEGTIQRAMLRFCEEIHKAHVKQFNRVLELDEIYFTKSEEISEPENSKKLWKEINDSGISVNVNRSAAAFIGTMALVAPLFCYTFRVVVQDDVCEMTLS